MMTTNEIMALTRGRFEAVALVDACVITDLADYESHWYQWSEKP